MVRLQFSVRIKPDKIKVQSYPHHYPPVPDVDDSADIIGGTAIVFFDSKKHHYVLLVGKKRLDECRHDNDELPCIVIDEPKTDEEKFALYLADKIYRSTLSQTMDISMICAVNALRWTRESDISVNEILELAREYDKGYGDDDRRSYKNFQN